MNQSTLSFCLSSLILLVIVGGCSYDDCHLNKSSKSETNEEFPRESVLIVSSVDGSLVGLSAETGRELWSIRNEPLVSQSLSKLEFVKDSKKFRLIPSLDGQLYMLEIDGADKGLRALPITADALFSSTFQLSTDSLLVGGKDQRVFGFNPFNGEVKYRCGRHGCEQESSFPGEREKCDLLICRRVSHVVRAVDLETGVEQWNFSVGQDMVEAPEKEGRPQNPVVADQTGALAQRGCIVSQGGRDVGRVRFSFGVEAGEIEASVRPPFTRIMWRRRFDASLSRVWLVEDGTVWQLALFAGDNAHQLTTVIDGNQPHLSGNHHGHSGCPRRRSLFLGAHRGHMYVQLEDGSATNTPHPLYVSLAPQNSVCSDSESKQKLIANSLSRRHRVAKMTRHEVAHLNQGFFRPPLQETIQQNNMWFVEHSRQEYYPPSTEPLAIRYGSFLFQKVVLGILVLVVTHLIFTNVYLPHQLKKKLKQNLSNYNITQDCHIVINCSSDSFLNVIDSTSTGLTELPPSSQTVVYESRYLSDYEHVRCLGKGAFGVVFEAKNKVDQYSYAVKRVRVRYSDEARTKMIQEVKAFAHLEHPGIVRYYQAWFELPPPGWQEAKDVEMGLTLREGGSEGSDDWTEAEHEESQDSTRCTTTSDWSRASLLNNDQDSLVIFDRSAVPHTSQNSIVSPSLSRVSSDHSNRNHPLASTHCSHIYLYICMHLYSSRSLKDWLQENQRAQYTRPSTPELLQIFAQIVDAVAYLHSNGLMHRDLKPSNILFDNQNHIRIVDFGLATSLKRITRASNTTNPQVPGSLHSNLTQANNNSSSNIATVPSGDTNYSSLTSNVGTELYMSPEQCDGSQYDQKVDVFALGIIFIELIVPLSTEMERAIVLIKARQLQFERWIVDSFPKEIAFASRLLNHDPKERPSCEEIFEDDLLVDVVDVVRLTRQRSRSVSSPRLSSE